MPPAPYGWPLRPFDRPHPVRGYFNDPRISDSSRAFHFGIDISAPDGTRVYAVRAGTVHREGGRSLSVVVGGRSFGYWHVVPAVAHREQVRRHQLIGHVEAGWGHVHFAETSHGVYVNPLRPGALEPWVDATSPRIVEICLYRHGTRRRLDPAAVFGGVDVVAEALDMPPLPVPPPWDDLPLTPARMRWRVLRGSRVARPWRTPVDFTHALLPRDRFRSVYAPGTRQNRPGRPGRYRFYLAHGWTTALLADGPYRIQVEASDESGNKALASLPITVANEV